MIKHLSHKLSHLRRFFRREDGTATIEFVIVFPGIIFVFLLAYDIGVHTMRQSMLERGVDLAVREIRLSAAGRAPTHEDVKRMICEGATNGSGIFPNCQANMNVELRRNDMFNWSDWPVEATCTDVTQEIAPVNVFEPGGRNELMLVRACASVKPFFSVLLMRVGLFQKPDIDLEVGTHNSEFADEDYYGIVAVSAFVNEPS